MNIELKEGGEVRAYTLDPVTGNQVDSEETIPAGDVAVAKTWILATCNTGVTPSCTANIGRLNGQIDVTLEIPVTIPGDAAALSPPRYLSVFVPPNQTWNPPPGALRLEDGRGAEADVVTALQNIIDAAYPA